MIKIIKKNSFIIYNLVQKNKKQFIIDSDLHYCPNNNLNKIIAIMSEKWKRIILLIIMRVDIKKILVFR